MGGVCGKDGSEKSVMPSAQKAPGREKKKIDHKGEPFTDAGEVRKVAEAWCAEPANVGWIYTGMNSLDSKSESG